ncbi:hypothetical protein [Streptomyces sp. BK79]|uniref:hypothetical protein n=1 Tax=Streptomyces sp. BK79 TaxID=3350097 RepID=UPI00376F90AA
MSPPGRRVPCSRPACRHSPAHRPTLAVQWAGRLLCWSLAAGMTTAATDLVLAPRGMMWHVLWPLPWYLTAASVPAWAILRAREKATRDAPEEDPLRDSWDQAA